MHHWLKGDGRPCGQVTLMTINIYHIVLIIMGRIPRFRRVSGYMQDVLHWLPNPQHIIYHISVLVQCCISGMPCILRESPEG